jgi:hypothetical protein
MARSEQGEIKAPKSGVLGPEFGRFSHLQTQISQGPGKGGTSAHLPDLEGTQLLGCSPSNVYATPIPRGLPHMSVFSVRNTKTAITFDFGWRGFGGATGRARRSGLELELPWHVGSCKMPSFTGPNHHSPPRALPKWAALENRGSQGLGLSDPIPLTPGLSPPSQRAPIMCLKGG